MITEKEAFAIIGERAVELSKNEAVQKKAVEIAEKDGVGAGEKYIYMLAIATLIVQ